MRVYIYLEKVLLLAGHSLSRPDDGACSKLNSTPAGRAGKEIRTKERLWVAFIRKQKTCNRVELVHVSRLYYRTVWVLCNLGQSIRSSMLNTSHSGFVYDQRSK